MPNFPSVRAAALAVFALASLSGCARQARPSPAREDRAPAGARSDRAAARANVERSDYAGSSACAPCHADLVTRWQRSPMHRMTRDARPADVVAPFDGRRWRFKDDAVVLDQREGQLTMRLEPASGPAKTYRVTRIIGGRVREDFAGVELGGGSEEVVLPVSYLLAERTFRYKGYSVMVHERGALRAGPVWSKACIFCHNTVPELDRLLQPIAGAHARAYQGQTVDRLLPRERRISPRVVDEDAFAAAVAREAEFLGARAGPAPGAEPRAVAASAIDQVRGAFDGATLVEVGIGCEACHGGSREHARDPRTRPSVLPAAPWLRLDPPPRSDAEAINRACARCHQVLFSRYPFTWEGATRDASPGGSHISSGEARDFLLGGCSHDMACTQCHDPHGGSDRARLADLATPAGNGACTGCHAALASPDRLRAHAHHEPDGAGGSCVACHMPRKNMGLDGTLTRYHRIGSPTDPARVLGDRPLECALCHVDESVGRLVDAMESWWPARYPRDRLVAMYGSLDANVLRATLERGKPHEQAVAIALLGERRARDAGPLVAAQLTNPYPLVREWARRALVSMLGRCDVDLDADDSVIARQAVACGANAPPGPGTEPPARDEEPED